jgi:N4-gp56 family major capsid protein
MAKPFDHGDAGVPGYGQDPMPHSYKAPPGPLDNPPSTVGEQIRTDYWYRRALVEAAKEAFFSQMADVRAMPKNMGKTIKQYHYLPILDDRNVNDQGIDAQGRTTQTLGDAAATGNQWIPGKSVVTAAVRLLAPANMSGRNLYATFNYTGENTVPGAVPGTAPTGVTNKPKLYGTPPKNDPNAGDPFVAGEAWPAYSLEDFPETVYFSGSATGADAATAMTAAVKIAAGKAKDWYAEFIGGTLAIATGGADLAGASGNAGRDASAWKAQYLDKDGVWNNTVPTGGAAGTAGANYVSGNLYGSARDVGSIMAKMPILSETGGRVNRVGMTRRTLEGSLEKFGFFEEYTQESLDFDTDSELLGRITSEAVKAANQITEDTIQLDLLHSAGVVRFCGTGSAVSTATVDGVVSYDDLVKVGIEMDNNRIPKSTRIIAGSRMIDTRVVNAARYAYIGSELRPTLMRMKDYFDEAAFIPVAQYAAAGNVAKGEIGAIGDFRFIEVPDMMYWQGAGKASTTGEVDDGTGNAVAGHTDGANINVYPILFVGDGAFTCIGFQTNGKTVKFTITHKKPGPERADRHDPYGEVGFWSIKWYYGFMALRPERIVLLKTAARY